MEKKVVLITGCSTGIGRDLALKFRKKDFKVYATARKIADIGDLEENGIKTDSLDVNSGDDIKRVTQRIVDEEGGVDILINNAGYGLMGPVSDIPMEIVRNQFETNLISMVAICQSFIPSMIGRKGGTIVNMGSVSGILSTPFSGIYCASKAAVHYLSDALRMELAPFNIRVLTVQPGSIKSSFGDNAAKTAEEVIKKRDSVYAPLSDAIRKRANSSQSDPTPCGVFTDKLVDEILNGKKEVLRTGKYSTQMGFMARWLPKRVSDRILMKKFSLDRI